MKITKSKFITYILMKSEYSEHININNLLHISKFKIWKIFKKEDITNKRIYLRNLLSEWIEYFEGSDDSLFYKVKKLIRKLKIKLSDIERDSLLILEERAFSEMRQIKKIEVNYNLNKGENVGAKYINASLYEYKNSAEKIFEGDLLISNKRIIFDGHEKFFNFKNMHGYSHANDGLEFIMENEKKYLIRIHDAKTLNNTFNNIINRKVKNDIKKY